MSIYNYNTSHIDVLLFPVLAFQLCLYRIFKTSVYAIFHAIAESCNMLSTNPEYDASSIYKVFKAEMKIFMAYMSQLDTTCEKQVAKQCKAQISPYQASVIHNNKLRPNGGSRKAVGAIAP